MATDVKPTQSQIKARVADLNEELTGKQGEIETAQEKCREIEREIRELQKQCSHPDKVTLPVTDILAVKHRDLCLHCGADVAWMP